MSSSSPRRITTVFGATGQQGALSSSDSTHKPCPLRAASYLPSPRSPPFPTSAHLAHRSLPHRAISPPPSQAAPSLPPSSPTAPSPRAPRRRSRRAGARYGQQDAVRRAVEGADCVFGVTVPFTPVPELVQGTNLVDASKEAGVKFFVWSSLPSIKAISGGKYCRVQHFEDKAEIEAYLKASGVPNASLMTGFFVENFVSTMPLKPTATGYHIDTPSSLTATNTVCWIAKEMGSAVAALMRNYEANLDEINGRNYILGHGRATLEEIVGEISNALGKPVTIKQVGKMGFPALDEMFDFNAEYDRYAGKPCPDPRLLAMGAEVGSVAEFTEKVLKPFLGEKAAK